MCPVTILLDSTIALNLYCGIIGDVFNNCILILTLISCVTVVHCVTSNGSQL